MVGGSRNPEAALRPPEAVVESAVAALQPILGIEGEPVATRCVVHADAIPQYDVGHPARLRLIETNLAALPGLQLAGASYRGVSVNSLVGEAGVVAERALGRG
jgi:oxygen-dependent protoporphyrinogen oxidase